MLDEQMKSGHQAYVSYTTGDSSTSKLAGSPGSKSVFSAPETAEGILLGGQPSYTKNSQTFKFEFIPFVDVSCFRNTIVVEKDLDTDEFLMVIKGPQRDVYSTYSTGKPTCLLNFSNLIHMCPPPFQTSV